MELCYFIPNTLESEETCLYKYRQVNSQSLQALILNQVWFSRPEHFNDPFEATDLPIIQDKNLKKIVEDNKKYCGILCLCKEANHLAMWSYYGDSLKGFAVGYNLLKLLKSIRPPTKRTSRKSPDWKYIIDVEYSNSLEKFDEYLLKFGGDPKIVEQEYKKIYATKSKIFEHEKECRIILPCPSEAKRVKTLDRSGLYSHDESAISEIIFGELMDKDAEAAIREIFRDRPVLFKRAKRVESSFSIKIEEA